jgi:hypothetical protein
MNLDFNKPEDYAFGMSIIDGGATLSIFSSVMNDINMFFHKEPVYKTVIEDGEVVEKQVDTILILRADKLRQNNCQIGEEYDDLEERTTLNHVKEIAVQLAQHRIDVCAELIAKLMERHIQNKEESKQVSLNI